MFGLWLHKDGKKGLGVLVDLAGVGVALSARSLGVLEGLVRRE